MGEGADVGDRKRASRKRAVGTREHIVAYLTDNAELFDPGGMASTRLAAAVGYPGSSVAFAQLLSGMERSGLIEREVRGKRTCRIRLGSAGAADSGAAAVPGAGDAAARAGGASGIGGLAGMLGPGSAGGLSAGGLSAAGLSAAGLSAAGLSAGGLDYGFDYGFDYDELARRLLAQVVRRLA